MLFFLVIFFYLALEKTELKSTSYTSPYPHIARPCKSNTSIMRTDYTVWCSIGWRAGQDGEAAGGGVRAYPTVEDEQ